jgi:hypothetical protein
MLTDHSIINAYKAYMCQQLDTNDVETRVIQLHEIEGTTWSKSDESQFKKIDRDIERAA